MKKLISIMMAIVMTIAITVVPVQAATYPASALQITMLKNKITQCKEKGLSVDYEEMMYAVIERFYNTYIPADTTKGIDLSVLNYEKNAIAELYEELNTKLTAYLDGTATPLTVNRPNMHNLTVNGKYIYDGNNPVFSIGYGFFGDAQADIPNFQTFGVNNIQMEIGPHQTWGLGSNGWNLYESKPGECGSIEIDSTVARTGSKSLHMNETHASEGGYYVAAQRDIPCKPNTTYTMGVWAKGTAYNAWCLWMKFGWDVPANERTNFALSENWQEYTNTYITGADQTTMTLLVVADEPTNVYLDDFYVYEKGSDVNLLANGGFEADVYDEVEKLKIHLNNAQNNNVAVSLLLAPHYLNNIAKDNSVPTTGDSNATFINFDINNAKAKEIIEAHIRGVLSNVKDYTCIDNICISNEPWFDTRWFEDTYNPLFRNYLVEKFGSLSGINSALGESFSSLDKIEMPEIDDDNALDFIYHTAVDAFTYEWMEFNDKVFADWHKWMAGIVKEYLPNTPVHAKVMENIPCDDSTKRETYERIELTRGTDYEMFSEFSDYSGYDSTNFEGYEYTETMFMYDYLQSAIGKPVYNSETHIIKDYYGNKSNLTAFTSAATKEALNKMWQGAIHGRSMSTVWAWQRAYDTEAEGVRDFYGGLMFRPDLIAGLGKMNLDFARLSDKLVELQTNSHKVAMLYSKPSRMHNENHIQDVLNAYKMVIADGYDVGVVTEKSIAKLSEYDTLIIPNATHTTQATRTAIENFAANGGKVFYTGSNVIAYDEHEKSLTKNNLSMEFFGSTSVLPQKSVVLKDTSGNVISGAEWQYSVTDERILVNVTSTTDKTFDVYYNGRKLTNMKELISNTEVSTVSLAAYEPVLLEYVLYDCEPNEILDLKDDSENSKITWKTVGENIGSVTIYKVNADKSVTYMANTTAREWAYTEAGTYIVCPVLKNGTELEGKAITTSSSVSLAVNRNGLNISSTVTNNGASYLRAKILVEALVGEEIVSYGYARTFVTPNGANRVNILLPFMGTIDSVRVTVCDDINNILAETTK